MRKLNLLAVLLAAFIAANSTADMITWTFDSSADLDDFDHTSGVTVGSDSFGSWVDLESTNESFEYMISHVAAVPSSSEWALIKTSYSEVWDIPSDEEWPMFGFAGSEVDSFDDPMNFIQIEANHIQNRQLEIFMRADGGQEQFLTIENSSFWENGTEWWLYWKTDQILIISDGGYVLFDSVIHTLDSYGEAWDIPTVPMHVQAEVGGNGGLSFDDIELSGNIIPEPATILMLGLGAVMLGKRRRS